MFRIKRINILNLLTQHFFLIFWISLFLSQIKKIKLGGLLGLKNVDYLSNLIGDVGITILLIISILIFLILSFNLNKLKFLQQLKWVSYINKLSLFPSIILSNFSLKEDSNDKTQDKQNLDDDIGPSFELENHNKFFLLRGQDK